MHRWLKGQVVWWTVCKSRLRYFRVNNPNPQKGHKKKPGMFLEFNYFDNELVKCSSYNAIQNIQKKNLNLKNMETIGNIRCPGTSPKWLAAQAMNLLETTVTNWNQTRHVFVKHGCPRRQQSPIMAKISKSYILTPPHPPGACDVSEVWATLRWTYSPSLVIVSPPKL